MRRRSQNAVGTFYSRSTKDSIFATEYECFLIYKFLITFNDVIFLFPFFSLILSIGLFITGFVRLVVCIQFITIMYSKLVCNYDLLTATVTTSQYWRRRNVFVITPSDKLHLNRQWLLDVLININWK